MNIILERNKKLQELFEKIEKTLAENVNVIGALLKPVNPIVYKEEENE